MTGGVFSVSRKVWDHPAFRKEPFTEREAWLWMVGEARWKRGVTRVGDLVVPLERGQLANSTRFAAKIWRWNESKVRRFYARLQKLEMIGLKTDAGVTVVSICNYDDYQLSDAPGDAGPTQDRRRTDAKENKDEIRKEEGCNEKLASSDADAPSPANDISSAISAYNTAAERVGWPQVQKLTPNRSKQIRARLLEVGGIDEFRRAVERAAASDFLTGRTSRPWTAFGFDWLIKSQNFTKLIEGNYDNRSAKNGALYDKSSSKSDERVAAFLAGAKRPR